jgi:hypothetical protein
METHSKSWRGPGGFLREYVIIVIGVLTALGGQQAVDWIHQQNELAETREALRAEIADDRALLALGTAADRCRVAVVENYVNWARGGLRPEKAPIMGTPTLSFSTWEVAKAGPLSRMPVKERLTYSRIYQNLVAQQANTERETGINLTIAQYFDLEQLNPDQAQRLFELSSVLQRVVEGKERVVSLFLSDVEPLAILPEPVPESRRQLVNNICKAAGLPAPEL